MTFTVGRASVSASRCGGRRVFPGSRFVGRRSAAHGRRDVRVVAVAARPSDGERLGCWRIRSCASRAIRKSPEPPATSPVKTRPVRFAPCAAGASASTSTRAVGSPNPGHGPAPIRLVPMGRLLLACNVRAVVSQARAARAGDDLLTDVDEVHRRGVSNSP